MCHRELRKIERCAVLGMKYIARLEVRLVRVLNAMLYDKIGMRHLHTGWRAREITNYEVLSCTVQFAVSPVSAVLCDEKCVSGVWAGWGSKP